MKSFDPNDPRITAYALGELHGAERDAFERELAASEELQRELKAINHFTDMMKDAPSEHGLEADQRADLVARCDAEMARKRERGRRWRDVAAIGGGLVAAACVVVLFVFQISFREEDPTISGTVEPVVVDGVDIRIPESIASTEPAAQPTFETELQASLLEPESLATSTEAATDAALKDSLARMDGTIRQLGEEAKDEFKPTIATKAPPSSTNLSASASGMSASQTAQFTTSWGKGKGVGSGTGIRRARGGFEQQIPAEVAFNTEAYDSISENGYHAVGEEPLSTFSIDVDTASYSNVRRFLRDAQRPPSGAVRIEEMINYFPYDYPQPEGDAPFSVTTDVARAPWNPSHLLARVGLQGREIAADSLPASNLVFLIDVSGSMKSPDKLSLLQRSLVKLVDELREGDRVAIVTYAGASGLELASTDAADKTTIRDAIERLGAGGSTNGAAGIQLAYETARAHFLEEGNNRVILCTDGDFNVGTTSRSSLVELIESERGSGVFLSVLSFGTGNLKDSAMEQLADKGNGNYAYIDTPAEGEKVLVQQMGGTLFTIAKDVKIQVEFNPGTVAGYRLIGYENRILAKEDFNDDTKDAGEIGAGHSVTALYEIVPAGGRVPGVASVDPLKYQQPEAPARRSGGHDAPDPGLLTSTSTGEASDLFTVKLRYKAPDGDVSRLIERPVGPEVVAFDEAPEDLRFAAAVAAFGMRLRGSENAGDLGWADIQRIARGALGEDPGSYRAEFLTLVEKAKRLD